MDAQLKLDQYKVALSNAQVFLTDLRKYIKDTDVPLDERWAIYLQIEESLDISGFYTDIPDMDGHEITYYDDLYVDRHQTVHYSSIVETLEESDKEYSKASLDTLKEHLLSQGYGGCINDW